MKKILERTIFVAQLIVKGLIPPLYSFERLETFCKQKISKNPTAHLPRLFLAHLYKDYRKYAEARKEFETLVQQGYKDKSILKALGEICYKLHAYAEAIRYCEPVTLRYSKDKFFNCNLGMSYVYTQAYEKALPYLIRAEELSLKWGPLYEAGGFCFFQLGAFERSAEWYRKALSFDPSSPSEVRNNAARAYVQLANALIKEGKRQEAIAQFHLALEVEPEDSIVHAILRTLNQLGEDSSFPGQHLG